MKLMLAKNYNKQNPSNYLMSEKFDGVRAVWDGKTLKSRNSNEFKAPTWFTESLPKNVILDGELWEGRGFFQKTVGKIRSKKGDWGMIKFLIFDSIINGKFIERLKYMDKIKLPAHCKIVEHVQCESKTHLSIFEKEVLSKNGEGVILRCPNSSYENGRSESLLRIKKFSSAEALIIGYKKGKGKNKNNIGALICKFEDKIFNIGAGISKKLRNNPPKLGSIVSFSFFGKTDNGIPRFSSFLEVRDYE